MYVFTRMSQLYCIYYIALKRGYPADRRIRFVICSIARAALAIGRQVQTWRAGIGMREDGAL